MTKHSGRTLPFSIARGAVLALAAALALAIWAPAQAHAGGISCTNEWKSAASGSWNTAADWSKGVVPSGSSEEACITVNGTYTVTLSAAGATVKSLTLGGSSGTQTLAVESSCSGAAELRTGEGLDVGSQGALALTNGSICADAVTLGGPVTSSGAIDVEPGSGGGARNLEGNLTNQGTLAVNADTSFNGSKATLTNEGALDLASGLELYVASSDALANDAGGSIAATGSANVFVPGGASFDEGAGTTSGSQPVIVEEGTLSYTGSGASVVRMRDFYNHLSGNISAGQSLYVEGCVGHGEQAIVDAAGGFSNSGSIIFTSVKSGGNDCGGNDDTTLNVESGTLTNTGTIATEAGTGGARTLNGNLTNSGTLSLGASAALRGSGAAALNEGAVELAEAVQLYVGAGGSFTNGAGGSIAATGSANVFVPGGSTFVEGAGTTSGSQPVIVEEGTLSYTGSGASVVRMRDYYSHLSGNISAGQSLYVEGCVGHGEQAIVDAAGSFSNAGSITFTSVRSGGNDCGGNDNTTLNVEKGGTLTNTGTITTEAGTGGARYLGGGLTNQGTLTLDTSATLTGSGAAALNEGAVELAEGVQLAVDGGGSFTNGAGGSIAATGSANVFVPGGSTFVEGAGTTSGSQPVIVEEGTLSYTGSGASVVRMRDYYNHLSGNISSGQSLYVEGCVGHGEQAIVDAAKGFSNAGSITFTSVKSGGNDCGGNDDTTLNVESGALTNTGTIATEAGTGGARTLNGSITNRGKLALDADTSIGGSAEAALNEGALDLGEEVELSVTGGGTFTNGSGGSIAATGTANVLIPGGSTFVQGAGTTSGTQPVIVQEGTLDYTGSGASVVRMRSYYNHLSGNISAGQSLYVEGCVGRGEQAIVDATGGFSNEGSITLTSARSGGNDCGGNDDATLNVEKGGTLTNTGTFATEAGTGGERRLEGSLVNDGLLSLGAGTTLKLTGGYTESAAGALRSQIGGTSDFGALSVAGSASIAGTVWARQVSPFKGEKGQKFAVLGAASRSGSFAHTAGATIGPDLYYAPVNTATGTNLDVLEGEPPEKVPTNVTKPTISGGTQQGQTIVLDSPGSWAQSPGEYTYQWLRCEASGADCQPISGATGQSYLLTGADAGHRITLQVIAYNGGGESAPAEPASPSPVITALPLRAAVGESVSAVEGEAVTLDGSGSTPASEIAKYRWQFGDGGEEEGAGDAVLHHVYATAGKYTAKLTVFRGGEEASASVAVTVTAKPKPAGGGKPAEGVYVTVKNGGTPVGGATVLYVGSGGARIEAASASSGEAVLTGMPPGTDTVYVYKSGLRPAVAQVEVNGEGDGSTTVTLSSGEIATAEVKSKELNYEEIVAAGINPSEPANQNVYKFVVKLAFIESPTPPVEVQGYVNSGGEFVGSTGAGGGGGGWSCGSGGCEGGGGGGGGGERIIAQPEVVEGHPLIQWLILHGKAAVLKQFFEVSMIVQNLSPEPFELAKGTATLNLPEGLSLAPTTAQQALTNEVPAVPGGGSATTNWIIRGDTPGEYNLSADYRSTLEPFAAPVSVQAALANPLKVWGKEAMTLKVQADEGKLHEGVPYHVHMGVENKSDVPLYNVNLTIEEEPHENFIFQPEQQFSEQVAELKPGETFFVKRPYILIPDAESVSVFNPALSSATFDGEKEHPGANIEKVKAPTLYPLESAASIPGYVRLKWTPVPGAEGYEVFSTRTLETLFANTPLSVLPSSSSKAPVTELPAGATEAYVPASSSEALWYAVSTVTGGHLELESSPMVKASAPVSTRPTVSAVSPASGSVEGGTHIRITGTNFVPGAKVEIGQGSGVGPTAIAASEVVVVSPTEITAVTGGGGKVGSWNLFVIDSGGTSAESAGDRFAYNTHPTVSSVSPASGSVNGGTHIRIIGSGFVAGATVEIGQGGGAGATAIAASEVVVVSPTEITAVTGGGGKVGSWNVFVIDSGGTSAESAGDRFAYNTHPTVSSVSPASGSVNGGTHIRIIGSGFVAGATVEIGQGGGAGATAIAASEVVVVSPTEITAVTGGSAKAGTWNLFVVDAGGTSATSTGDGFTYK